MIQLLGFFSGLFAGAELVGQALAVAGLICAWHLLGPWPGRGVLETQLEHVMLRWAAAGAWMTAVMQAVQLGLTGLALETGDWISLLASAVVRDSVVRMLLAFAAAASLVWVCRSPRRAGTWLLAGTLLLGLVASQAWVSHAASRIDAQSALGLLTVIHVAGAMLWAGGVMHLLLCWHLLRRADDTTAWRLLLRRFTPLGMVGMLAIVVPGGLLAFELVGSVQALLGTGHGIMLLIKLGFLSLVLALAASNFRAAHDRRFGADVVDTAVPAQVEVEAGLALALLLAAATLAALPPGADVVEDAAAPAELYAMFSPKIPHLAGAQRTLAPAPELIDISTGAMVYRPAPLWSNFTHNLSGVIVTTMGLLALLARAGVRWARHWPLLWFALAAFVLLFAEARIWPIGDEPLLATLADPEVLQHRLAGLLVIALGVFEWRVWTGRVSSARTPYLFPVLCMAGGVLLITHNHEVFALKEEFLIQSTHTLMAFFAIVLGGGRWLELRVPGPGGRRAGLVGTLALLLLGLSLLFYREPVAVLGPGEFTAWVQRD